MEEKKEEHHHSDPARHSAKKKSYDIIFISIAVVLGIILIANIFFTFSVNKSLKKNIDAAKEAARPGKIELVLIKNSKCTDCFDISSIVKNVKSSKSNVTGEKTLEFDSIEGKELISKYQIKKIPTLLVTGELNKVSIQGLESKGDALVLTQISPPYTDAATGKISGRVSITLLKDKSCEKCNDLRLLVSQIRSSGIRIAEEKNVTIDSVNGQQLASKYKIDFVPSLILSQEAADYTIMQRAWPQIGTKEKDGFYILRSVYPPYINLTTGKVNGLIDVIYLNDSSCTECYDVSVHKQILTSPQSFAMTFNKEETLDISTAKGKDLIAKYNITKVPTAILSDETNVYPAAKAVKQFYSKEKDNSYVFRSPQVIGAYKDLNTNSVVKPQPQIQ